MSIQQNRNWITRHEKDFLDGLGSYGRTKKTHKDLLQAYIKTAENTGLYEREWYDMNRSQVIEHAKALLESY